MAAEWNRVSLDEAVAEVTAAGGTIVGVAGDVSNRDDDQRIIQAAIDSYARSTAVMSNGD